jgi:GT2 family glycosyltransferase
LLHSFKISATFTGHKEPSLQEMKVSVVILNWNGKKFLSDFLPKVIAYSKDIATVIVADNASTDDSVSFLKQTFPEIRIIQNPENGGFAKGYNDALKQVESDYFILLNSDVEVSPGWIEPLLARLEADQQIGAAQPKMLDYYKRDHFEYAGAAGGFIDSLGYPFCRGRIFSSLEKDNGQYNTDAEIFWATGACMMVRAEVFKKLGGFDEEYFAHMEEIDLCWRIRHAGYKIICCPASAVYHVGGGTLPKSNSRKTYLNFRNNLITVYKNSLGKGLLLKILGRLILDGVAALKFLIEGHPKDFLAVAKAHFYFYRTIPKQRKKRKAIQKNICDPDQTYIFPKSIVSAFYLRGIQKFSDLNW